MVFANTLWTVASQAAGFLPQPSLASETFIRDIVRDMQLATVANLNAQRSIPPCAMSGYAPRTNLNVLTLWAEALSISTSS